MSRGTKAEAIVDLDRIKFFCVLAFSCESFEANFYIPIIFCEGVQLELIRSATVAFSKVISHIEFHCLNRILGVHHNLEGHLTR